MHENLSKTFDTLSIYASRFAKIRRGLETWIVKNLEQELNGEEGLGTKNVSSKYFFHLAYIAPREDLCDGQIATFPERRKKVL